MIKKIITKIRTVFFVTILIMQSLCVVNAQGQEDKIPSELQQLYAKSACLLDADSGRILFGKNETAVLPMASTTKIMTCIVALEYGNPNAILSVSSYASSMPDVQLNIKQGESYHLKDLLYSLMLESHNDSAVAIAEYIGAAVSGAENNVANHTVEQSKEYVKVFTGMMNQKAKDIGCYDTCFLTPNGLDATASVKNSDDSVTEKIHSTTAADLAKIMAYCIKKSPCREEFLNITRTETYSFTNLLVGADGSASAGGRSFSCTNHNAFLKMMEGALSGKTGFTGKAGYCYVGSLERNGKTYVVALLACGWPNNKSYKWSDTKRLMNYALDNYEYLNIEQYSLPKLPEVMVKQARTENIGGAKKAVLAVEQSSTDRQQILLNKQEAVDVICKVRNNLTAPLKEGTIVGSVQYIVSGQIVESRNIVITEDVEAINLGWCMNKILQIWSGGVKWIF